jgi:cytolysin (calcineurin-like family phosphatase)
MSTEANEYVFCFINDPQFRDGGSGKEDVASSRSVVKAINNITSAVWPDGVSCAGRAVAAPFGVFVNGDLTKWGGGMQFFSPGEELDRFRGVFERGKAKEPIKYPTYFGLGNHDLSAEPADTGGIFTDKNEGRNRMWDFIRRSHVGYNTQPDFSTTKFFGPVQPVFSIDAKVERVEGDYSAPNWKKYSFNYSVDLPGLHVVQLHCYGGDARWGRAGGLDWLKADLAKVGTRKRIVVCQHFGFSGFSVGPDDDTRWREFQIGTLLNVLRPYNVVGVFHGHDHNADKAYQRGAPITDINHYTGPEPDPSVGGWNLIPQDLSKGQGGFYDYVIFERGSGAPITEMGVNVTEDPNWIPPSGFKLATPFTFTRDGKQRYAYIYFATGGAQPIRSLDVLLGDSPDIQPPDGSGFVRLDPDLRKGSGGKYAYLCYSKEAPDYFFFDPGSVTKGSGGGAGGALGIARVSFPGPDNGTTRLDVAYGRANDDGTITFNADDSFTKLLSQARAAVA